MKSKTKSTLLTISIILGIAIIAIISLNDKPPETDREVAECIGSKAILYTQLGCHACEAQEDLFGKNYQYLDVIDCWYDHQACIDTNITATPTWIINNEKVIGVQTIEKLQELTGCWNH